jgi:hypothetical protein
MGEFDPAEPAILHDRLNDRIIVWTGELGDRYVDGSRPRSDGIVEWDGLLLDGWGNVLGG